jgi:pimeloyl-ACP methyl ester carboxylesterase
MNWPVMNFEYEELFFENDGIRLHAIAAGPKLGPVVVLLHGFPEFWYQLAHIFASIFEALPDEHEHAIATTREAA